MSDTEQVASAMDEASEDDRRWFEAHPHRQHRIRLWRPGEGPPGYEPPATRLGWKWFVAVRQLRPGLRARLNFEAEGQPATGERAAARIFNLAMAGRLS